MIKFRRGYPKENHFAFKPADLTTPPHFIVSSLMYCPNSSGEPGGNIIEPSSANRDLSTGFAIAALISELSFATICGEVFFGAQMPVQKVASNPGKNSARVGTSGS